MNIVKMKSQLKYLIPFVGGLLYALALPNPVIPAFPIYPIIGMGLFISQLSMVWERPNFKRDALTLLIFCFGIYLLGYYWIPFTLFEFGGILPPFNYVLGAASSLIIAPHLLIFIALIYTAKKRKYTFTHSAIENLVLALVLTLLEILTPQQFPAHLGHSWLNIAPYISPAPYFGAYLYSLISYWVILSTIGFIRTRQKDYFAFITFFVVIAIGLLTPIKLENNKTRDINVRLVQANIGNNLKLKSERGIPGATNNVEVAYYLLSSEESKLELDLIVWPETAFPETIQSSYYKDYDHLVPKLFKNIISDTKADIFFGGYDIKESLSGTYFEDQFNAAFLFGMKDEIPSYKNVYHKMKLIPFGETLPFGPFNKSLSEVVTNISYFAAGKKFSLFETKKGLKFISAICYEVLFESFIRTYLNSVDEEPQFIINISNDSWYGDTSEPYQHQFLTMWRAVEFNIPIIRSTNTGISSILYPDGSTSESLDIGEKGFKDIVFKVAERKKTPYQKWGLLNILALWSILFLCALFLRRQKSLFKKVMKTNKS